jgi:hypothetical protein
MRFSSACSLAAAEEASGAVVENAAAVAAQQEASPQLTVAEVRRALASLRRGWEDVTNDPRRKPLYLSDSLGIPGAPTLSMEAFALRFVLAHHTKRLVKVDGCP